MSKYTRIVYKLKKQIATIELIDYISKKIKIF